jgi:hypothetical protein
VSNDEFFYKNILIKNGHIGTQLQKNNKVKYLVVKQFKTHTMQTKHGIKK